MSHLILVMIYNLTILSMTTYLVGWQSWSGWWFLLAVALLASWEEKKESPHFQEIDFPDALEIDAAAIRHRERKFQEGRETCQRTDEVTESIARVQSWGGFHAGIRWYDGQIRLRARQRRERAYE